MSKGWNTGDIPDQSGRVAVVTGANSGLGLHAASALAERGARVVLAVRNVGKGEEAAQQILCRARPASRCASSTSPASTPSGRSSPGSVTSGSTCS